MVVEKIKITNNREIHIQVNEYKGRRELDIRTYILTPRTNGTPIGYTQKGIRVPPQFGPNIAKAIMKVISNEGE
jgi:hypothetical protein